MANGQTLLVLAIIVGCFAVLGPKIIAPMLFQSYDKTKPDRMPRPGPEFGHPALRGGDRGRPVIPGQEGRTLRRTIDKELKPGPVPGMRPSMGGPGIQPQAAQRSQGGSMGILMPLYTIGIVCFFVYTVLKIVYNKKDESEDQQEQQTKLAQQYARLDPSTLNAALDEGKHFQKMQAITRPAVHPDTASTFMNQVQQSQVFQTEIKANEILGTNRIDEINEEKVIPTKAPSKEMDSRDEEIFLLKQRLEETERAMKIIFDQIAKNSQAELTTSKTTECDLNENATLDDENSSTESVDILYDNLTLRMKKSDAEALPQKDEKTSHNNEKMTQDEENNFDDKHESVEEESNSCSNTNEIELDDFEKTGMRRRKDKM